MNTQKIAPLLLLAACASAATAVDIESIQIGSASELWLQRNDMQKLAYLEGMCEGLGTTDSYKLSHMSCSGALPDGKSKLRFCGLLAVQSKDAVRYLDKFYKSKNQTDVPNWAAIGAYNDAACSENISTSRMPKMQRRLECFRNLSNMPLNVIKEARQKQEDYCNSFPVN